MLDLSSEEGEFLHASDVSSDCEWMIIEVGCGPEMWDFYLNKEEAMRLVAHINSQFAQKG